VGSKLSKRFTAHIVFVIIMAAGADPGFTKSGVKRGAVGAEIDRWRRREAKRQNEIEMQLIANFRLLSDLFSYILLL